MANVVNHHTRRFPEAGYMCSILVATFFEAIKGSKKLFLA